MFLEVGIPPVEGATTAPPTPDEIGRRLEAVGRERPLERDGVSPVGGPYRS